MCKPEVMSGDLVDVSLQKGRRKMKYKEIENQMEFLMRAALQKCGNLQEAEDLCQEVLLAICEQFAKGKEIADIRGWMLTVLNRRFYDNLRKKYRRPTSGIGEGFEVPDESEGMLESIVASEEAESVRRELAYLTKTYREVLVRHYMKNQSVAEIAEELNIPEGTVKSRLYLGRNRMKKGMEEMEKYSKSSYEPVTLKVSNSGYWGMNGEPGSLVNDDLMAQNLLWLAYAKPIGLEELSKSIGIPAAYVEPLVKKLVDGELMKQVGNKYYTDFIIHTVEDEERYIPAQKAFVKENFDLFWRGIEKGLEEVREKEFYKALSLEQRNSLEMYFVFYCLDQGCYGAFVEAFNAQQIFRDRPNGGRWIAFGCVHFKEFDYREHMDLMAHSYSGERWERFENFAGAKRIELHVYGADGFPARNYYHMLDEACVKETEDVDAVLLKLLYLIREGIKPEEIGFNLELLKSIPWLEKCKILRRDGEQLGVNIPVLSHKGAEELWGILNRARNNFISEMAEKLADFMKDKKQEIPAHLNSVPLQKQYMYAANAIVFAAVREAMKQGKLYDGDYDNDRVGMNQPPCPMVMIVEK